MNDVDVAVVGGGLAGLGAAAGVARLGHTCVAFTGPTPGGHLVSINSIQGMPGHPEGVPGYDLCPMAQEAAMDAGVDCRADEALGIEADGAAWIVRGGSGTVRARCVILAPGGLLRKLGVPG